MPRGKSSWWLRLVELFTPEFDKTIGEEVRRQYRTVAAFVFIGSGIIFGFGVLNAKIGNTVPALVEYCMTAVLVGSLFLLRSGRLLLSAHIAVLATTITIGLAMWYGGGMSAAAIVFLPMLPAVGLLSIGRSGGAAGLFQALALIVLVAGAQKLGFEPKYDPPDKLFAKRVAEAVVVVLEIWALSRAFFNLKDEAFGLLAANRDELAGLLNNMRQGVLAFGRDRKVSGNYSEQARVAFGQEALETESVVELLYPGRPEYDVEAQHFALWVDSVFAQKKVSWDEVNALAPTSCVRFEGTAFEQHLRLEFRPIFQGRVLSRVMLLVTDETRRVQEKRAADAEKMARERMLGRMRRLATSGAHVFLQFLRHTEERLQEIQFTLKSAEGHPSTEDVEFIFRQVHTIKGEARTYDLERLEQIMVDMENECRGARVSGNRVKNSGESSVDTEALQREIEAAQREVEVARDGLVSASPIGSAILDQVTVSRKDLESLRKGVGQLQKKLGGAVSPLLAVTARLSSRPFGESTGGLVDAVSRWAEQNGKRAIARVGGKEVQVNAALAEELPGVLTHLVRNAVAHGLELPETREEMGKADVGLIRIECTASDSGAVIVVADDGRGVDLERIQERAQAMGLKTRDPLDLLFADGLSTSDAASDLSGQGVGMSAVREALMKVGYEISVSTEDGKGTVFTMRPRRQFRPTGDVRQAG